MASATDRDETWFRKLLNRIISWEEFHAGLEYLDATNTNVRLRKLATSPYNRPFDIASTGHGKRRLVFLVGVHANEPAGMTTALLFLLYFAARQEMLRDHDLTVSAICLDPDGLSWNTWPHQTNRSLKQVPYSWFRDVHLVLDASNGLRMSDDPKKGHVYQWYTSIISARNQEVLFVNPLHDVTFWDGAFSYADGPGAQSIVKRLDALPAAVDIRRAQPGVAESHSGAPFYPNAKAVRHYPTATSNAGHMSIHGFTRLLWENVTSAHGDSPLWTPTQFTDDLVGRDGESIVAEAKLKLDALNDLIFACREAALTTNLPDRRMGAAWAIVGLGTGWRLEEEPELRGPVDAPIAFHRLHTLPVLRAFRAGLLVQLLESGGAFLADQRSNGTWAGVRFANDPVTNVHALKLAPIVSPTTFEPIEPPSPQPGDHNGAKWASLRKRLITMIDSIVDDAITAGNVSPVQDEKVIELQLRAGALGIESTLGLKRGSLLRDMRAMQVLPEGIGQAVAGPA